MSEYRVPASCVLMLDNALSFFERYLILFLAILRSQNYFISAPAPLILGTYFGSTPVPFFPSLLRLKMIKYYSEIKKQHLFAPAPQNYFGPTQLVDTEIVKYKRGVGGNLKGETTVIAQLLT